MAIILCMELCINGSVINIMDNMTKKFFDPFSPNATNMIPVILDRMSLFGITTSELSEMYDVFIADKKKQLRKEASTLEKYSYDSQKEVQKNLAKQSSVTDLNKCSKCGSIVKYFSVNSCKGTKIGGGFTKAKLCTAMNCMHTEYIK